MVDGFTNQEIADQLYLSVKTVETYRARVMGKLEIVTAGAGSGKTYDLCRAIAAAVVDESPEDVQELVMRTCRRIGWL